MPIPTYRQGADTGGPIYNDATLAAQEAKRRRVTDWEGNLLPDPVEVKREKPPVEPYRDPVSAGQLVDEARGAIRSTHFFPGQPLSDQGEAEAALSDYMAQPKPGLARQITTGLEMAAGPAMAAGLVPSPVQPAALGLAALGYGAGGLRKLIAPEADESQLGGALQLGASVLPYTRTMANAVGPAVTRAGAALGRTPAVPPSVQALREAIAGAREDMAAGFSRPVARKLNKLPKSSATPTMPNEATNPSLYPYQSEGLAADRATRAAVRADLPITPLGEATAPAASGASPMADFYAQNPMGVGRTTGQFTEGPGGLSSLGGMSPYPLPPAPRGPVSAPPSALQGLRDTLRTPSPSRGIAAGPSPIGPTPRVSPPIEDPQFLRTVTGQVPVSLAPTSATRAKALREALAEQNATQTRAKWEGIRAKTPTPSPEEARAQYALLKREAEAYRAKIATEPDPAIQAAYRQHVKALETQARTMGTPHKLTSRQKPK